MPSYQPKTAGGFSYKILDRIDGNAYGRVFRGTWIACQWTRAGVASTQVDDNLVRTDTDRVTVELYWIDADGMQKVVMLRPADPSTIIASKSVNLREGVIEI